MAVTDTGFVTLLNAVAATGAGTTLAMDGAIGGATVFELVISATATVTWQATVDGTNWYSVQAENLGNGDFGATATASGLFRVECTALGAVRPNVTSFGSGTVTVRARSANG